MHRRLTGLAAAAVCALIGTLILIGYVRSAEARALSGEETVDVLVVTEPIDAGTPVADLAKSVEATEIPEKVRAEGAVTDLSELEGLVTRVDLVPGEQVVRERFGESTRSGAPEGLLEVTVALEAERALGGRLAPGDLVGVTASFEKDEDGPDVSRMILHKVLVTSVMHDATAVTSQSTETDEEDAVEFAPSGRLMVTLALDAASVDKVVFAAEHGFIWLSAEPAGAPSTENPVLTRVLELS